jgi:hypothetical protein
MVKCKPTKTTILSIVTTALLLSCAFIKQLFINEELLRGEEHESIVDCF